MERLISLSLLVLFFIICKLKENRVKRFEFKYIALQGRKYQGKNIKKCV
jgi:hypothetical protein